MKRETSLRQIALSLVVIAAWLTVSNHCALAAVLSAQPSVQAPCSHCSGHSAPAQEQRQDTQPCCKNLPAATMPTVTAIHSASVSIFAYLFADASPATDDTRLRFAADELDTGPPAAESFATSVLQRSLRAHAPPFSLS